MQCCYINIKITTSCFLQTDMNNLKGSKLKNAGSLMVVKMVDVLESQRVILVTAMMATGWT